MATQTTNLNLTKQAENEYYDINIINENLDKIDQADGENVKKVAGKGLSTEDYTTEEKTKLAGVEDNANKYIHPATHNASIINQDSTRRFVSDTEKATWNAAEQTANQNADKIGNLSQFQTATGTGNAITLSNIELTDGFQTTFIAIANNSASATTINGKSLYKPNTTDAPNLVTGKAYTVWYSLGNDCFFIKASAEGDATADKVLAGYTFSNDNDTGIDGTMVDNGAVNITPSTVNKTIPQGYHNGSGIVQGNTDLIASNIRSGKDIFGVVGSLTPDSALDFMPYINTPRLKIPETNSEGVIPVGFAQNYVLGHYYYSGYKTAKYDLSGNVIQTYTTYKLDGGGFIDGNIFYGFDTTHAYTYDENMTLLNSWIIYGVRTYQGLAYTDDRIYTLADNGMMIVYDKNLNVIGTGFCSTNYAEGIIAKDKYALTALYQDTTIKHYYVLTKDGAFYELLSNNNIMIDINRSYFI